MKERQVLLMGGDTYREDVEERARAIEDDNFFRPMPSSKVKESRLKVHEELDPRKKLIRECRETLEHPKVTSIVVAIDSTLSRRDDIKIIYKKLPMFIGQIVQSGYCIHPEISFAAVGDVTAGDQFPIQIGEFESDNKLEEILLEKMILESSGGGGTGEESYQLMAYFYAEHSFLDSHEKRGKKGYFFFIGDESFYDKVSRQEVKKIFGEDIEKDLDSKEVFKKLQEKYHVFLIYPQESWEVHKKNIDAEIRKRLEAAGGQYKDVDIRASLIWNDRNDLDLHCITPDNEHISYQNKVASNGALDVDRNVHGETTKPVENIRWLKTKAKKGKYRFYVENYAYHNDRDYGDIPFKVEVEINGQIQSFEHETPAGKTNRDSRIEIISFDYDPDQRQMTEPGDYDKYQTSVVLNSWKSVIPESHILMIKESKAMVDAMLGILALHNAGRSLDDYAEDMDNRDQTPERQKDIRNALEAFSFEYALEEVDSSAFDNNAQQIEEDRATGTERL